ncbi:MAG: hypothetical protein WBX25_09925 [Rhodomicrobium sp.]
MFDEGTFTATIEGDEPYQQKVRRVLPLLVTQAQSGSTVTYSDLTDELGLPHPKELGLSLGPHRQFVEGA